MGASAMANAVAGRVFGLGPVFNFRAVLFLPQHFIFWVILLGLVCGLLGDLFKRSLYFFQDFYGKCRIPPVWRPVVPLLVSVPLGFLVFEATGGGHGLIEVLGEGSHTLKWVLAVFMVKLLFTALCYGSGCSGGIFLPLLACGALTGHGMGLVLEALGLITGDQILNFVILGMAAFFAGVVKAPVTGMILILEMTGNFNYLGNLVVVCLSSYITGEIIHSRPVYAVLLERLLRQKQEAEIRWEEPG
jgi:H+/Cl- antiporter ClcA